MNYTNELVSWIPFFLFQLVGKSWREKYSNNSDKIMVPDYGSYQIQYLSSLRIQEQTSYLAI